MSFSTWIQSHRRSLLTLLFFLAIAGAIRAFQMPVGLFPQVTFPRVVVTLSAGDQPAEQMEIQVTRLAEMAVRSVPGVLNVRSTTSRGSADISLNFSWDVDMVATTLQVSAALNQIQSQFPAGTSFTVRKMDPTIFPMLAYSLTSTQTSQVALRDLASFQLVPLLSSVDGVARVDLLGGKQAEYQVTLQPDRMQALGITPQQVAAAITSSNILSAVGRIEDRYKLFLTIADARLDQLATLRHTVLTNSSGGAIYLQEVAEVSEGAKPEWLRVTADRQDAVLVMIYQQPGSNSVQIASDVHARLKQIQDKLPHDVMLKNWYDQSQLIIASAQSVRDAIFIGMLLASLVLFAFLRNLRVTLITLVVVPAVFAITVLLLHLAHFSFNIMTLGGMAAAVGLVIDDAIVMIEQIIRRVRNPKAQDSTHMATHAATHESTIMQAAAEFLQPLLGSSLATTIIFLPLAFLDGVTGAFFKALSLTMAIALVVSFLLAWLAVPLLSAHALRPKDAAHEDEGPIQARLLHHYTRSLGWMLHRPALLLVIATLLLSAGVAGYRAVGSGFMPQMDEGGFILDYVAPAGMSLSETDRLLQQIETILQATPEVSTYSRRTGAQLGGGLTEANQGDFFVRLKGLPRRDIETIMDEIREKVHANVPALDIDMALLMEDVIGDLTAVPQPIEIKLFGDDPQALLNLAPTIAAAIETIDGVVDVRDGIMIAGDAITIHIDRNQAAWEGFTPDQITQQISTMLTGQITTTVQRGQKMVDVRMIYPTHERDSLAKLKALQLQAADGHKVALQHMAKMSITTGQPQITRENLKRMVAVTGRISGRDMGSVMREVKALLATDIMPPHIRVELGGLYLQQQKAFQGLAQVFVSAVMLVFILLLFLYERFRVALAILSMPLLAMGMVFLGLALTGTELNITAMMGLTMIIGIVTETAIFYYSEFRRITPSDAHQLDDYIQAGRNRFRPIAMTTLAAILSLLPLALALGEGSAMLQPMAIAIIFGLMAQFPLVLLLLPVLLFWLDRRAGVVKS